MANSDTLSVVLSGVVHLLASQIAIRLITFSLNLLVARRLSPEAYGLGAVQYHLFLTIILQVCREGFRRGCIRGTADGKVIVHDRLSQSVRVTWYLLPWSVLVTAAVTWTTSILQHPGGDPMVLRGYYLHAFAALLELAAEPLYIAAQQQLQFKLRVMVEAAATIARSCTSLGMLVQGGWHPALAFSWAQVAFGSVVLAGYSTWAVLEVLHEKQRSARKSNPAAVAGNKARDLMTRPEDKQKLHLTLHFTLQAAGKLVLAEGSRMVMAAVGSATDQGVYGLVTNLGSLVVRVMLQPLEEVAFTAFSRQQVSKSDAKGMARLGQQLGVLVRGATLLGLLAVTYGPAYSQLLLMLLYGSRWSHTDAPTVLSLYCAYILLLAVNGITEAFVHAVQDEASLQRNNGILVGASMAHMTLTALLAQLFGTSGLVLADAFNMLIRISYSVWYISRHFSACKDFHISQLLPSGRIIMLCAGVCGQAKAAEYFLLHTSAAAEGLPAARALAHIGVGAATCGVLLARIYSIEGPSLRSLLATRDKND